MEKLRNIPQYLEIFQWISFNLDLLIDIEQKHLIVGNEPLSKFNFGN